MKYLKSAIFGALLVASSTSFAAGTVNILWYTGGTVPTGGSYSSYINNLVSQEQNPLYNVSGSVNTWNVTFWSGGAMPAGSYNVMVSASQEGGWNAYPNYSSLVSAAPALGNRVMVTGQDADWHYMNFPGSTFFNNPAGFLIDAINWAGSGTGMGAVFLSNPTSVLASLGLTGLGVHGFGSDSVVIPVSEASFPINLGLTSAGLSSWSTSAHDSWSGYDTSKWNGINLDGSDLSQAVTLVSASTAGGGTGGAPEVTSTAALLLGAFAGLCGISRRVRNNKA